MSSKNDFVSHEGSFRVDGGDVTLYGVNDNVLGAEDREISGWLDETGGTYLMPDRGLVYDGLKSEMAEAGKEFWESRAAESLNHFVAVPALITTTGILMGYRELSDYKTTREELDHPEIPEEVVPGKTDRRSFLIGVGHLASSAALVGYTVAGSVLEAGLGLEDTYGPEDEFMVRMEDLFNVKYTQSALELSGRADEDVNVLIPENSAADIAHYLENPDEVEFRNEELYGVFPPEDLLKGPVNEEY